MPKQSTPDLSHLSGKELAKVAESLTSGPVKALMEYRESIVEMSPQDIEKMAELASHSSANCGGIGCG